MKQWDLFLKEKEEKSSIDTILSNSNPFLGPKTQSMGYEKYINSNEWKNKREIALKKRGNCCERCYSKKNLEVHHIHYDTLYHERLNDIEVLCRKCHPQADVSRAHRDAYRTYVIKKYGDDCWKYDSEYLHDEFDEWIEWKEREDRR